MRKLLFSLIIIATGHQSFAQNHFTFAFDKLVGKSWHIKGKWSDGTIFNQEVFLEYGLDKHIVIAKTKGYTKDDLSEWGDRNYGIRQLDAESGQIKYYEFDIFGGMTSGRIETDHENLEYIYSYRGMTLADSWIYVDDQHYSFKVREVYGEGYGEVYLDAKVVLIE